MFINTGDDFMGICPVCNGMIEYIEYCPRCGARMKILDRTEAYDDEYSPYVSFSTSQLNDGDPPSVCTHKTLCEKCGFEDTISVDIK